MTSLSSFFAQDGPGEIDVDQVDDLAVVWTGDEDPLANRPLGNGSALTQRDLADAFADAPLSKRYPEFTKAMLASWPHRITTHEHLQTARDMIESKLALELRDADGWGEDPDDYIADMTEILLSDHADAVEEQAEAETEAAAEARVAETEAVMAEYANKLDEPTFALAISLTNLHPEWSPAQVFEAALRGTAELDRVNEHNEMVEALVEKAAGRIPGLEEMLAEDVDLDFVEGNPDPLVPTDEQAKAVIDAVMARPDLDAGRNVLDPSEGVAEGQALGIPDMGDDTDGDVQKWVDLMMSQPPSAVADPSAVPAQPEEAEVVFEISDY